MEMLEDGKPVAAIVQQAEAPREQLIETAKSALSTCNWIIGECASSWVGNFVKETDATFGPNVGLSSDQVYQRRRVWEKFNDIRLDDTFLYLKWSHYYSALNWDDASECLKWARDHDATVAEMKEWRKAQHEAAAPEPPPKPDPTPAATEVRFPSEWVEAFPKLTDEHFIAAVGWKDREESLEAADTNEWTVDDMLRWHKALSESDDDDAKPSDDPPKKRNGKKKVADVTTIDGMTITIRKMKKSLSLHDTEKLKELGDDVRSFNKVFEKLTKIVVTEKPPVKKKAKGSSTFQIPALEEVAEYCKIRGNSVNPEAFMDHYISNGWKVGRVPMKDWKAAVRKWEQSGFNNSGGPTLGGVGKGKPSGGSGRNSAGLDRVFGEIKEAINPDIEEEDVPF
jgi:hypothetical protein